MSEKHSNAGNSIQVKLLTKQDETYMEFEVKNITPAIANSIRRTMLAELPILAIDEVVVLDNNTVLYDEIIAHRLALIPLKNDPKSIAEILEKGSPEDFRKQEVPLVLEVECNENLLVVYSGQLKSNDPVVKPAYDKIPIVKMTRGQRLIIEAYAHYGLGKDHARWQPVSVAAYKYFPVVEVYHDKCLLCGQCINECPKGILKVENEQLVCTDPTKCILCEACSEACPTGAIRVYGRDDDFIFKVESTGSLPVSSIPVLALKVLKLRFRIFLEKFKTAIGNSH